MLSPISPGLGRLPLSPLIPNEPKGAHVEPASRVVSLAGDTPRAGPHSRLHKRGPLWTCEKRGMVRGKERKNKNHSTYLALKIVAAGGGRRVAEVADEAESVQSHE